MIKSFKRSLNQVPITYAYFLAIIYPMCKPETVKKDRYN